ncbi:MAG: aminoacyl-tRNA hydrolase [Actinobacteria bacterium]|nr:aminoacyl-tRNA hydrolase [Actinomycetota bacterium]
MSFFRKRPERDANRWVVVGLGNPGPKYAGNRHNVGAMVVDVVASDHGTKFKSHKSGCLVAELGGGVALARPTSYMNESGRPVAALLRFYKVPPENLVVVHDELDIPFGNIRVKFGGGVAGHNGLKSVAQHLGTKDFVRIRFGISRPPGRRDPADYVLSDFTKAERSELPSLIGEATSAIDTIVERGVERAMNETNART